MTTANVTAGRRITGQKDGRNTVQWEIHIWEFYCLYPSLFISPQYDIFNKMKIFFGLEKKEVEELIKEIWKRITKEFSNLTNNWRHYILFSLVCGGKNDRTLFFILHLKNAFWYNMPRIKNLQQSAQKFLIVITKKNTIRNRQKSRNKLVARLPYWQKQAENKNGV